MSRMKMAGNMENEMNIWKSKLRLMGRKVLVAGMKTEDGIDGILVTVGLCIIALLLCVVMKDSLTTFIQTIITSLTTEAQEVLSGVTP